VTRPAEIRVLLLTRYPPDGASSRVRFYQYLELLREDGIAVSVAPFFDADYLPQRYAGNPTSAFSLLVAYTRRMGRLLRAGRFDLIWIEYDALPWLPKAIESLMLSRRPYVVDYDDAIFVRYGEHANRWRRALVADKIAGIMRGAAVVTAANERLAEYARASGASRVEYCPTAIDVQRYEVHEPSISSGPAVIGWIGSPSTAPYLRVAAPALRAICADGRARFVAVGSGPLSLPDVPIEVRPWSVASEVRDIESFDIGIMPLPDDPWARGKSGYKLIQYMAASRPVVASAIGANCQIVQGGRTGLLVTSQDEWVAALRTLCADAALRTAMGRAGRELVEQRHDLRRAAPRLAKILKSAAAQHRSW
jgi:glycosyltransferase involved in cell wall biosynthesis